MRPNSCGMENGIPNPPPLVSQNATRAFGKGQVVAQHLFLPAVPPPQRLYLAGPAGSSSRHALQLLNKTVRAAANRSFEKRAKNPLGQPPPLGILPAPWLWGFSATSAEPLARRQLVRKLGCSGRVFGKTSSRASKTLPALAHFGTAGGHPRPHRKRSPSAPSFDPRPRPFLP